jgi:hypothetical protein
VIGVVLLAFGMLVPTRPIVGTLGALVVYLGATVLFWALEPYDPERFLLGMPAKVFISAFLFKAWMTAIEFERGLVKDEEAA